MFDGFTAFLETVKARVRREDAGRVADGGAKAEPVLAARAGAPEAHASGNRAMFDRIAPSYDAMNKLMTLGIDRRWRARAVELLGPALRRSREPAALDLCAGTMDLAASIEKRYPDARVVAFDASARMLELGAGKVSRATAVVGDALAMPFADASFDVVICGFGVRNLADLRRGLREIRRVLRPGGVFVTLEVFRPRAAATRFLHGKGLRYVLPVMGAAIAGDRDAYAYLAESMEGFVTREGYEALLAEEGYSGVRGTDLVLGVGAIVEAARPAEARP